MFATNLLTETQLLDESTESLAETILNKYYQRYPHSAGVKDKRIRAKSLQDYKYHLLYLSEAVISKRPELFVDYAAWVKVTLTMLGLPLEDIVNSFLVMQEVLDRSFSTNSSVVIGDYLLPAIAQLTIEQNQPGRLFEENELPSDLANAYMQALLRADRKTASEMVLKNVNEGMKIEEIYLDVFQPVLRRIGYLWQMNQVTVAQEHYCTAATQMIMSQLYPFIFKNKKNGKMLIGACVGGELHEIGMRMVADFYEMSGWDTIYLGANMPSSAIIKTLHDQHANMLGLSATMTFNVHYVRNLIQSVRKETELKDLKILVGGYPFNLSPELWKEIGADGSASSASDALAVGNQICSGWN